MNNIHHNKSTTSSSSSNNVPRPRTSAGPSPAGSLVLSGRIGRDGMHQDNNNNSNNNNRPATTPGGMIFCHSTDLTQNRTSVFCYIFIDKPYNKYTYTLFYTYSSFTTHMPSSHIQSLTTLLYTIHLNPL